MSPGDFLLRLPIKPRHPQYFYDYAREWYLKNVEYTNQKDCNLFLRKVIDRIGL